MVTLTVLAGLVLGAVAWYRLGVTAPSRPIPADTPGRMRDAQASVARKDYARADSEYRMVLQADPDNGDARAGLVRVLGLEGRKTQIPPLLMEAANRHFGANDLMGAADLCRQVLQVDSGNVDARRCVDVAGKMQDAQDSLKRKDCPRAASLYKAVLQLDTGNAEARKGLQAATACGGPHPPPPPRFTLHLYSRDTELTNGQEFNILDDKLGGLAQNELKFMLVANRPPPVSNKYLRLRWVRKTPDGKTDQIADREMTVDAIGTVQPLLSRPRAGEQEIWFEWNGEEVASFKFTITPAQ